MVNHCLFGVISYAGCNIFGFVSMNLVGIVEVVSLGTPLELFASLLYRFFFSAMTQVFNVKFQNKPVRVMECLRSRSALADCITRGDFRGSEILLRHGFNPNIREPSTTSHLSMSISYNQFDIFLLLLRYSADVNSLESNGDVPLHIAVKDGNVEYVRHLILRGATIHAENIYGFTPLDVAVIYAKLPCLQLILSSTPCVTFHSRIYHLALLKNPLMSQIVDKLLSHSNAYKDEVHNPRFLCMAVFCNHISLVESLLCRGANANWRYRNCAPLEIACSFGCYDMLLLLTRYGAEYLNNSAPLFYAINHNHPVLVKGLLRLRSPIFISMYFEAIIAGSLKALEVILNFGTTRFNVNSYFEGITLIHFAVLCDRPKAIPLLVNAGGDINLFTDHGYSALHIACIMQSCDSVATIINNGGNIYVLDYRGRSIPLELSRGNEKLSNLIKLQSVLLKALGKNATTVDSSTLFPNIDDWTFSYADFLKCNMISETNISVFTLLTCSEREMANYLDIQSINAYFRTNKFREHIYLFAHMLNVQFVKGYTRRTFITAFFCHVVPTTNYLKNLPIVCMNKILDYISTEEIGIMAGNIQKRMVCPHFKIPTVFNTKTFEQTSGSSFLVTLPLYVPGGEHHRHQLVSYNVY